jgi:tetraacyldisaccharide 4'-kinase
MNYAKLQSIHQRLLTKDKQAWSIRVLFALLLPLACLYGAVGQIRYLLYRGGLLPCYRAALPVLSVGNLAAGGTGKTPTVDWLIKAFSAEGKNVAVLSRGYGGQYRGKAAFVSDGSHLLMDARTAGDEPCLLARNNPQAVVAVAAQRKYGLKLIEDRGDIDLVILDDAFQHLAVARDVDMVLLDEQVPLGNGWPLPAGNLREFPTALKRADLFLLTRSEELCSPSQVLKKSTYFGQHHLACTAISLSGESIALLELKSMRIAAFSGIAHPEIFFDSLRAKGLSLARTLALPDHVEFSAVTLKQLTHFSENIDLLLTTEKDAVKLKADQLPVPCYQIPLELEVGLGETLINELSQRLWGDN